MKRLIAYCLTCLPIWIQLRIKKRISLVYDGAGYGDTLMVAAVAREIKMNYGAVNVTINRTKQIMLQHNPYVDSCEDSFSGIDLNYHYTKHSIPLPFTENLINRMCTRVGIRNPSHRLDMFLTPDELQDGYALRSSLGHLLVTIQAQSGSFDNGRKLWPHEYWIELVKLLTQQGYVVAQLGGAGETDIPGTHNFTGKLSIRQSIALIHHAIVHVGIVSSLMHGAAAIGKPSVIIYGGFEQYLLHGYATVYPIEASCSCSPCIRPYTVIYPCPHRNACMRSITPQQVFTALCQFLPY